MTLNPGSSLGPYEILAKIGEGGMGEVYQARDTTLDRDVALKVLPEAFTSDPDRLVRFEREAKVLASLNHPNIGGIYGLEQTDDTRALVLELVEGPTLAERIAQGPIPVSEATGIATQIAEALGAAHAQGVIHRDLKPANVKVRPDGTVKVLDFGLAKAFQAKTAESSASLSPTISLTAAATQMGMVIGTAAYMAPEQAGGKPVDKRADVWALGVVLYEMLTGQRPFAGDDVSKTLAHVIAIDPDWDALPDTVPPVLGAFLRRCLAKDPNERVHDVADLRLAMEGAFGNGLVTPTHVSDQAPLSAWQRPLPLVAGALLLAALAAGGA
jgi:serine/threonine protein kinase